MSMQLPTTFSNGPQLGDLAQRGLALYEDSLGEILEREHFSQVVAIEPDSGEYAIGSGSSTAVQAIRLRDIKGRVFVRRIGPPSEGDNRFAARVAAAEAKSDGRQDAVRQYNREEATMDATLTTDSDRERQHNELTKRGIALYEGTLKDLLEREHLGKVVGMHPDTGDYVVADSSSDAMCALRARHPGGLFVTTRIGPPTAGDLRLAARVMTPMSRPR